MRVTVEEFRDAMLAAGITPPSELIGDGRLYRFHVEGHRRGTQNGAYVLHLDGNPAGWFQDFKSGVSSTWKSGGGQWHMDEATKRQIEEERQKRRVATEARYLKKAAEARVLWCQAERCAAHPYLDRKGVKSHGLRVGDWPKWLEGPDGWRRIVIPNSLLVPMADEAGTVWNLQAIFPAIHPELGRDKDFLAGRKTGLFFIIGAPSLTLRIAEGYATAATIHEATGDRVFVAFDAGNLPVVAGTVRKLNPAARIVICADNDRFTQGNPGISKAREAALAVGGLVSIPAFPEGAPGTDWNDLLHWRANHGGA